MASCVVARRLTSQLFKLRSAPHEQVNATRAFASVAAGDSSVEIGRNSSKGQEKASKGQEKAGLSKTQEDAVSRGAWPGSAFPSLFSPFMSYPSSFLRPTSLMQMMDTVDHLFSSIDRPLASSLKSRMPWDAMEDDKCFKLRMDMPGMTKEDVKLSVEDGDLVVKAEHKADESEDDWSIRSYGSYNARIKLPENVDFNQIKAELKDGVLKVQTPKVEGAKQKHEVPIQ